MKYSTIKKIKFKSSEIESQEITFGSFTVELCEASHDLGKDYQVNLYCDGRLLESYDHEYLDRAKEDYNTLRQAIKHVLNNLGDK